MLSGLTDLAMLKPVRGHVASQNAGDDCATGGNDLSLFPFPEGWYFVASRRSVAKKQLIQKQWLGQEIVVWCDNEGTICVAQSV